MIKLEHTVLATNEQMDFVIEGMRNPKNSWDRSDSYRAVDGLDIEYYVIGPNDMKLMQALIKGGPEHRKFMRQIFISVDITAPFYW